MVVHGGGVTVKVWEWISDFIPQLIMDAWVQLLYYLRWDYIKETPWVSYRNKSHPNRTPPPPDRSVYMYHAHTHFREKKMGIFSMGGVNSRNQEKKGHFSSMRLRNFEKA